VNCRQIAPGTVAALLAAVDQVAAQLEPAAAHRLLATALKRQHADAALHMLQCKPIGQHVESSVRLKLNMLVALLVDQLHLLGREQQQAMLVVVRQSSMELVGKFMQISMWRNKPTFTRMVCRLPAAQRFSSSFVTQMLQAAVQHKAAECAAALCALPQLRSISADVLEPLLQSAVAGKNMELAQHLAGLPAAAHICFSSEMMVQMLQAAVTQGGNRNSVSFVERLCRRTAASELSSNQVEQLLCAAVEQGKGNDWCTAPLCDLPGAKQLSSEAVARLLQAAVQHSCGFKCVRLLCHLPGARSLSSAAVAELLQAAVGQQNLPCTKHMCQLPAARRFSSAAVLQLLQAAVQHSGEHAGASSRGEVNAQEFVSSDGCIAHLCKLPAAEQLGCDELMRLVEVAEGQRCTKCADELRSHGLACQNRSSMTLVQPS
jgi:hypothetical protein